MWSGHHYRLLRVTLVASAPLVATSQPYRRPHLTVPPFAVDSALPSPFLKVGLRGAPHRLSNRPRTDTPRRASPHHAASNGGGRGERTWLFLFACVCERLGKYRFGGKHCALASRADGPGRDGVLSPPAVDSVAGGGEGHGQHNRTGGRG